MTFNPYEPYGPPATTTMRIVTWNVWGRYGAWEKRQAGIEAALVEAAPDLVCIPEAWSTDQTSQPAEIAARLGLGHQLFVGDWHQDGWTSGIGMVSRWPISTHRRQPLPGSDGGGVGEVLFAAIDGPRGVVQLFVVMLDFPLFASAVRQGQVRQLANLIEEVTSSRSITVVCGDFNAGPDSDELRMLTGRRETAAPGLVFYDAWELAGDGSPGHTWSNRNPLAAAAMYPDLRIDYILSAWPRANAVGHPTNCELLGVSGDDPQLSDHYGLLADLRY